jgi:hypothetical protein
MGKRKRKRKEGRKGGREGREKKVGKTYYNFSYEFKLVLFPGIYLADMLPKVYKYFSIICDNRNLGAAIQCHPLNH